MTQRIFDVKNEKDMADLWNILPDECMRIVTRNGIFETCHGETIYYNNIDFKHIIKINWHDNKDIKKVLAPVPSYEEWQQLKEYERIVTSYNMKPIDYDIACETVNKLLDEKKVLKEENAQLKELLRECSYRIDWRTKTGHKPSDDIKQKLFDEIDQVLRS